MGRHLPMLHETLPLMRLHSLLALFLTLPAAAQDSVRITEWMYKGNFAEFVEITNLGAAPVDLAGWSLDDDSATPGTVDLSPLGVLAPNESAIVTEAIGALFATEWSLSGVKILTQSLANLARNDQINVYDAGGVLHDRLTFGDQDFPGSPRTDAISAYVCDETVGVDYVWGWTSSALGDAQGSALSLSGDIGSPGQHAPGACAIYRYCGPAQLNSAGLDGRIFPDGSLEILDNSMSLNAYQLPLNKFGYFLTSETQGFVSTPPGSEGDLCLGGKIGRYSKDILNTGVDGAFTLLIDLSAMPLSPPEPVLPGETWNFTAWYRDNNPNPTSNFTDAIALTFE